MKLAWVAQDNFYIEDGVVKSMMASTRYRLIQPATGLAANGFQLQLQGINAKTKATDYPDLLQQDCVIFGKCYEPVIADIMMRVKAAGVATVVDICDNNFTKKVGAHYIPMLQQADLVVASTEEMAQVCRQYTDAEIVVVSDPYEAEARAPHVQFSDPARLLWYGSYTNLPHLYKQLPQLERVHQHHPCKLTIISNPDKGAEQFVEQYNADTSTHVELIFKAWDLDMMNTIWDDTDIVIIPSEANEETLVKSPNRVVDSVRSGRYVVAQPVPSYLAFTKWVSIGDDIYQGLMDALNNPSALEDKITQAQQYIDQHHAPATIAAQWGEAVQKAVAIAATNKAQVKLNLGCGDKILPGYINVDVAESRKGKKPDVLTDLKDLSCFENDYADEILSVHVVEHFWRWEIEAVLAEWIRVLKPGGKMIIECPNLISAAQAFLENPDEAAWGGPPGQRSMWVFYGDPSWEDPLMVHRWGYTPNSLMALLNKMGLTNIRQEPAQFKLREPRDMRIVADKP